jgi:type I restriction enzyme S subunit
MAPIDDVFHGALLNQRVGKLVTDQNILFVYYLLQTSKLISDIDKSISGSEPPNLSTQQIEDLRTRIPLENEQQKIANCLSSLDELITAQTRKIDALKTHKKGLMQGLFPNPSEEVQP